MTLEEVVRIIKEKVAIGFKSDQEHFGWEISDFGDVSISLTFFGLGSQKFPQLSVSGCRILNEERIGRLFHRLLKEFIFSIIVS